MLQIFSAYNTQKVIFLGITLKYDLQLASFSITLKEGICGAAISVLPCGQYRRYIPRCSIRGNKRKIRGNARMLDADTFAVHK